jgi:hypothetical protein
MHAFEKHAYEIAYERHAYERYVYEMTYERHAYEMVPVRGTSMR